MCLSRGVPGGRARWQLREPQSGLGGKIDLDATNKLPPETHRAWGRPIRMSETVVEEVSRKWASFGLPGSGKPIWK